MEKAIRGSGHMAKGVSDSGRSMRVDKGGDKVEWKVNQMGAARHESDGVGWRTRPAGKAA